LKPASTRTIHEGKPKGRERRRVDTPQMEETCASCIFHKCPCGRPWAAKKELARCEASDLDLRCPESLSACTSEIPDGRGRASARPVLRIAEMVENLEERDGEGGAAWLPCPEYHGYRKIKIKATTAGAFGRGLAKSTELGVRSGFSSGVHHGRLQLRERVAGQELPRIS